MSFQPLDSDLFHIFAGAQTTVDTAVMPDRLIQLDARFERAGAWSGVSELLEEAFVDLRRRGLHDIIDAHNHELHMVLQDRRAEIPLNYATLTHTAIGAERTRNFPLDRAYRIVNGLVSFIQHWKALYESHSWVIIVRHFSATQHLARRFFTELARRSSTRGIAVCVEMAAAQHHTLIPPGLCMARVTKPVGYPDQECATPTTLTEQQRERLESAAGNSMEGWERAYPALLEYYRQRGDELATARVALRAICLYNHYGYYHESASFADMVLPYFDELIGDDEEGRWNYSGNIFQGLVTTGQERAALRLIEERVAGRLTRPVLQAKMHYLLSMVYVRYLKPHDIPAAERHILAAADAIEAAQPTVTPAEYAFLRIFIRNGLAFVRVRQNRMHEALQLCESGFRYLGTQLGNDEHRLHRSVLLYNCAQVYLMLGDDEQALALYEQAITMDPHYSEYYNESGNVLQRLGRNDAAIASYDKAIQYSAPYPEVYYNKAVCQIRAGDLQAALISLSCSEELNPLQPDLYALRADIADELGNTQQAYVDYSMAIELAPDSPSARVNRAVLCYNRGDFAQALTDMNHVIAIDASMPSHYENRAAIYAAMAEADLARSRSLQSALPEPVEVSIATH